MKKLFTLFAMCIAFIAVANAHQSQLPRKSGSENLKSFTVTTEHYGCINSGDVPSDAKISITHNGSSPSKNYLYEGDNNIITIEDLSPNVEIQKIEANIFIDDLFGISEITASIGDNEIGKLSMKGLFVEDYDSFIIAENDATYELNLDGNVSHFCTKKLSLTQTCTAEYAGTYYYTIYYTISEPTGINDIKTSASNDVIYNLQGIRVDNPVKGNIYIKGGKKIAL